MRMAASRRSLLGLVLLVMLASGAAEWWYAARGARLGSAVAQRAQPGDIVMISSDTCTVCMQARLWFRQHQVPFSECSIERDAACAERFRALAAPGTPVILVRGKPQLGFRPERLLEALT